MKIRSIINGSLYTPTRHVENAVVLIEGSSIVEVGAEDQVRSRPGGEVIDAQGNWVMPGLIDMHLHGVAGCDATLGEALGMAEKLPQYGVTAFLPVTSSASRSQLIEALTRISSQMRGQGPDGARILGIHMEGPYLSPRKPGGQLAAHFRRFDAAELEEFVSAANGLIRIMTIAPEAPGNMAAIPFLLQKGIVPSIGHSDATFEQVQQAMNLGLRHATVAYNSMRRLHHRELGVVGAVLLRPEFDTQVIGDGIHVDLPAIELLVRVKGMDKVALVSDAASMTGLPYGTYEKMGRSVTVDEKGVRLEDGTICGGAYCLNLCLRNLVEDAGFTLPQALSMATEAPARQLGLNKGAIVPGRDADVVILGRDYWPRVTIVEGNVVFKSEKAMDP
jgi:N-acetylglucosamine-6-phosphate deacetylase